MSRKSVKKCSAVPANSMITTDFGRVDYHDTYLIYQTTDKRAEEISKELMQLPDWVNVLFFIRNRIAGLFGLKTDRNTRKDDTFFSLIENREDEIVMGEDDKHLNFRASVLKDKANGTVSLTTVVHYNNLWGRVYFFPVKPFHKIIMKTLLKRYLRKI
ncbi:MAG: DUF2867 domain-containing protein [Prevotellaceae bacterium]|nr:DUF2867 domain-containing protein [Prevotellaceae bacterium]